VAALIRQDGHLMVWQSLDVEEAALRMGRAAVRDLTLAWYTDALLALPSFHAAHETNEGGRDFYPMEAVGASLKWVSGAVMPHGWLVIQWCSKQAIHPLNPVTK
jgi:hypothetical protein